MLTDYEYQAGVYEIDYGQGGPDVIIIRNGEIIEEPAEGAPRPPMIRVPTPGLNIITPTPPRRERSDRMPPSTIIPEIKNPKPEPDAEPDQERKENEPEPILN